MKKRIIFLIIAVGLVLLNPLTRAQSTGAGQKEFKIQLKTYLGITSQTPTNLITCIRFSSNNRLEMFDGEFPALDEEGWWYFEDAEKKNVRSGQYSINNVNGLDFITISWSAGTQEKYLFLTNNEIGGLYLYKADSTPYFKRSGGGMFGWEVFGSDSWIKASSFFKEIVSGKTIIHSPDKLGIKIGECWVPNRGTKGQLTLSIGPQSSENIYISNGFVSFLKPNLYRDNSRIKKIRLYNNSGHSKIVELKDSPHFQSISIADFNIPFFERGIINIEILEVYQGTKYPDTCLNSIYWFGTQ